MSIYVQAVCIFSRHILVLVVDDKSCVRTSLWVSLYAVSQCDATRLRRRDAQRVVCRRWLCFFSFFLNCILLRLRQGFQTCRRYNTAGAFEARGRNSSPEVLIGKLHVHKHAGCWGQVIRPFGNDRPTCFLLHPNHWPWFDSDPYVYANSVKTSADFWNTHTIYHYPF